MKIASECDIYLSPWERCIASLNAIAHAYVLYSIANGSSAFGLFGDRDQILPLSALVRKGSRHVRLQLERNSTVHLARSQSSLAPRLPQQIRSTASKALLKAGVIVRSPGPSSRELLSYPAFQVVAERAFHREGKACAANMANYDERNDDGPPVPLAPWIAMTRVTPMPCSNKCRCQADARILQCYIQSNHHTTMEDRVGLLTKR